MTTSKCLYFQTLNDQGARVALKLSYVASVVETKTGCTVGFGTDRPAINIKTTFEELMAFLPVTGGARNNPGPADDAAKSDEPRRHRTGITRRPRAPRGALKN